MSMVLLQVSDVTRSERNDSPVPFCAAKYNEIKDQFTEAPHVVMSKKSQLIHNTPSPRGQVPMGTGHRILLIRWT
jgi:hypothetical protein